MTVDQVADQLGITARGVETALRRGPEFPRAITGASSGPTARWKAAEIYDFQLSPDRDVRRTPRPVPRLHPRPRPAGARPTFIENLQLDAHDLDGRRHTWIAHLVDLQDGGEPIAITFRTDRGEGRFHIADELTMIRRAIDTRTPARPAIVLPRTDIYPAGGGLFEPYITVLDQAGLWYARWEDLTAIAPGFPLPWWDLALRSSPHMRQWRPGQPPLTVEPPRWHEAAPTTAQRVIDGYGEWHLTDAGADAARRALTSLIDADRSLVGTGLSGSSRFAPTVHLAAVPPAGYDKPVPPPEREDLDALLHLPIDDPRDAQDLLSLLPGRTGEGVIEHVRILTPEDLTINEPAAQWRARLRPANSFIGRDARELGFITLADYTGDDPTTAWADAAWVDPLDPQSWALVTSSGAVAYAVTARAARATGHLATAQIHGNDRSLVAFFTDDAGTAWPIPAATSDEINIGYDGSGPDRLVRILHLLATTGADADTIAARHGGTPDIAAAAAVTAPGRDLRRFTTADCT